MTCSSYEVPHYAVVPDPTPPWKLQRLFSIAGWFFNSHVFITSAGVSCFLSEYHTSLTTPCFQNKQMFHLTSVAFNAVSFKNLWSLFKTCFCFVTGACKNCPWVSVKVTMATRKVMQLPVSLLMLVFFYAVISQHVFIPWICTLLQNYSTLILLDLAVVAVYIR